MKTITIMLQTLPVTVLMGRILVWFSCGAASAVAAKKAVEKYDKVEVLYCDTLAYEHPDNIRFLHDVSKWIGQDVKIIKSEKYTDIYDVFFKTRWLVGTAGARCTGELKKKVRENYQKPGDVHVFGFTSDEDDRINRFIDANSDLQTDMILEEEEISKNNCYRIINEAGIEMPAMYKLGFHNNNCIGCVKAANMKYWERVKRLFPEIYWKMAKMERLLNACINMKRVDGKRIRLFLDELTQEDFDRGRNVPEPDMEGGVVCIAPEYKQIRMW